ncbi:hypothetical protein [Lewinella sp. IMCC34191]|uniref:hypothetical protein n=1 Tax=Lewinella sp. IMCC34191 TaxID=2259172 RepID=UPI000E26F44A|nr:hypothetical protein [Lewinella sp. IMCC34191]
MTWLRNTAYAFLVLLLLPFPFVVGDLLSGVRSYYHQLYDPLVSLVGRYLLGTGPVIRYTDNGSGDGLYNWVYHLTVLLLAVVVGGLITLIWKDRPRRSVWSRWILLLVAFSLSYYMLIYGLSKLYRMQFVRPFLTSYYETYGRSSPMHLLWTFMGYSRPYVIFTGLLEVIAGVLLLPRRTRTAGALFTLGIMSHVFMLNVSYDVPVKVFSAQLILLSLVIIWSDRTRLWGFITNQPIAPHPARGPQLSIRGDRILSVAKYTIITALCFFTIRSSLAMMADFRQKSPLYGVYEVAEMQINEEVLAPLVTNTRYWKRIIFDRAHSAVVILLDDTIVPYRCDIDSSQQNLQLLHMSTGEFYMALHYNLTDTGMELSGRTDSETVSIQTEAVDVRLFGINRGLHWVNEVPFNRYQQ